MQPLVEIKSTPAQAVTRQPAEGEQPPINQATPVAQRDEQTKEEKARALLQGEPPKDAAPDTSEEASIDAQFDPETDELLDIEQDGKSQMEDGKEEKAEAEAETHGEKPAGEAEAEAEEEEEETKGEESRDGGSRRIRVKRDALSDRDFAILTLAKDKRITFAEAEQQLFGKAAPRDRGEESTAVPQAQAADEPTARQINEQIGALRTARERARELMDEKAADKFNDQIIELRDRLREVHRLDATRAQAAQQTAAQKYVAVETAAISRAVELYPEANTKGSRLNEKMQAKAASLHGEDPAFFQNPKWPILLAVETATELGIAAKVKESGKAVGALPIPKKTTRPAPLPAPGTATSARNNTEAALREELNAAKANRDVEGIKAVMRKLTAAV